MVSQNQSPSDVKRSGIQSVITIDHATFSYDGAAVFSDVTLGLQPGETLCLLGPNGCGKTTLIDCILGIHPLDTGRILIRGEAVTALTPKQMARHIAYVPQNHTKHFSYTVMDVLLMGRTPYLPYYASPSAEDVARVEAVLDEFRLYHLRDRDYTRLSGGETQLVMIMRALVQDTPVIIMDEPTAHLDFRNELMVLEAMVRLASQQDRTLVMASHFPNHAFYLENEGVPVQVAFMNHSTVTLSGGPSQALTQANLEHFYRVSTQVVEYRVPREKRMFKQIIPIHTLDKDI